MQNCSPNGTPQMQKHVLTYMFLNLVSNRTFSVRARLLAQSGPYMENFWRRKSAPKVNLGSSILIDYLEYFYLQA